MTGKRKPNLIVGDSYLNANLYYLTGVLVSGQIALAYEGEEKILLVPEMEIQRVKNETAIEDVRTFESFGYLDRLKSGEKPFKAFIKMLKSLIGQFGAQEVCVEQDFPLLYADLLRSEGFTIIPEPKLLVAQRRKKEKQEIESIRRAVAAAEKAMSSIEKALSESDVVDGFLVRDGEPQTSEGLRLASEIDFIKGGYQAEEMIVSSGVQSGEPHNIGFGPIEAGVPIVVDIFPFSKKERYYADMTRTFSKGKPKNEVRRMYRYVQEAQEKAIEMVEPGINAKKIHENVCKILDEGGYQTFLRGSSLVHDDSPAFHHSTGHGVGLEVHEAPSIGEVEVTLKPGDVVTIEPGLYHPQLGGVRIEDLILVTDDGCEVLSKYRKKMMID